jgi:hypothetical protein
MRIVRVAGASLLVAGGLGLSGLGLSGLDPPASVGAAPVITNWYRLPAAHRLHTRTRSTWQSSNWSGYAEVGHFGAVSGHWKVPTVTAGATTGAATGWFSSAWIGIDGFSDTNLIQTGTEQDYYGGSAHYSAWWEILPKAETVIPRSVSPGDSMSASIVQTAVTVTKPKAKRVRIVTKWWDITLSDNTRGWTFTTTQVYRGPGDSSEFVVEAPVVGRAISTLSDYRFPAGADLDGDFSSAQVATTIGGASAGAGLRYASDAGILVQNGVQVSTPGLPDTAEEAFNSSYGAAGPAPPRH